MPTSRTCASTSPRSPRCGRPRRSSPPRVRIHALVNNAGRVVASRTRLLTDDGFEATVGGNFLGHFALTTLLFPALAADGRVVGLGSDSTRMTKLERRRPVVGPPLQAVPRVRVLEARGAGLPARTRAPAHRGRRLPDVAARASRLGHQLLRAEACRHHRPRQRGRSHRRGALRMDRPGQGSRRLAVGAGGRRPGCRRTACSSARRANSRDRPCPRSRSPHPPTPPSVPPSGRTPRSGPASASPCECRASSAARVAPDPSAGG